MHFRHALPHLSRPKPGIPEAVDQGRDQVAAIGGLAVREKRALQYEPQVKAFDALRGPIRRELFGADPPYLLCVGLEEDVVEPPAELVSGPVLEVAGHAADRLDRSQVPERVGGFDRIGEVAAAVVDPRQPAASQHLRAEDLRPQVLDLLVFGEETMATDVEAVALVLDRASKTAHVRGVLLDHSGRDVVLHQLVGGGQTRGAGADDHDVVVAVLGTQCAHSINGPDAGSVRKLRSASSGVPCSEPLRPSRGPRATL